MNEKVSSSMEREPRFDGIKVFKVRHGQSNYEELRGEISDKTVDITEKGIEQIKKTAEYLKSRIDKENDVVVFAHSPRRRAVDSMKIIYDILKKEGFNVVDDLKNREVRVKMDNAKLFDENNNVIEPGTREYADAAWKVIENEFEKYGDDWFEKSWMKNEKKRIKRHGYEMESLHEVKKRSKDHLAFLMRMAKRVQPGNTNGNIVLIEVSHGENMQDFLEHASGNDFDGEIENGGVVEMFIPSKGKKIKSNIWTRNKGLKELKEIEFDYLKRDFV